MIEHRLDSMAAYCFDDRILSLFKKVIQKYSNHPDTVETYLELYYRMLRKRQAKFPLAKSAGYGVLKYLKSIEGLESFHELVVLKQIIAGTEYRLVLDPLLRNNQLQRLTEQRLLVARKEGKQWIYNHSYLAKNSDGLRISGRSISKSS